MFFDPQELSRSNLDMLSFGSFNAYENPTGVPCYEYAFASMFKVVCLLIA